MMNWCSRQKNEEFTGKPAPSVEHGFFASAIMKVAADLIYISEIVSSNFLFCQTFVFVSPCLSLSVYLLLPGRAGLQTPQPVRSLCLCSGTSATPRHSVNHGRVPAEFSTDPDSFPAASCGCAVGGTLCPVTLRQGLLYCFINVVKL